PNYQVQRTTLVPLTIPLGTAATAQATRNVFLQGTLTPSGAVADTAGIVQSAVLGDSSIPRPDASGSSSGVAPLPSEAAVTTADNPLGGTLQDGANYQYEFTFVDANGKETLPSGPISITTTPNGGTNTSTVNLNNLPAAPAGYASINIYRTDAGGTTFKEIAKGVA